MRCFLAALAALALAAGTGDRAEAGSLTTLFAFGSEQNGNMFDIKTAGNALTITGFDLNLADGAWNIAVYTKSGTWVGFDQDSGAWTQIGGLVSVTSAGVNNPSFLNVADFVVAANAVSALYITITESSGYLKYTDGTAVGDVAASNADLTIFQGAGKRYPFDTTYEPRIWNGTIFYNVNAVPEPSALISGAIAGLFGDGYGWRRRRAWSAPQPA